MADDDVAAADRADEPTPEGDERIDPENRGPDGDAGDPETGDPEAADPETGDPEAGDPEAADPEAADPETADAAAGDAETSSSDAGSGPSRRTSWLVLAAGLTAVLVLAGLIGWLGYRVAENRAAEQQRELFVQVGRQAAVNLTTIDHNQVEDDIQRIIDGATGSFREDFETRSDPFAEVVRQAQSTSEGTITEAGLESVDGDRGRVLVTVSVKTSVAEVPEEEPRSWRMRITVQQDGDEAKVSNVEFVP
ncbi:mammalian cell entry protein [Mycolicibacterium thermoresistibile]